MAVAALVALVHDIVITVGVYSVLQFEVTPATMIGILTILGYSLYDTVVVFDKVKENTRGILGQSRQTYSQAANLAVNQTLVRSINTSIVALLPVAAILFVGAGLLGAGTLKDLSLALFVGMAAGTYSSIFIATPFLAQLMERNPQMKALAGRVKARGAGPRGAAVAATAAVGAASADTPGAAARSRLTLLGRAQRPWIELGPGGRPAVRATSRRSRAGPTGTDTACTSLRRVVHSQVTSRRSRWPIRRPCPSIRRWSQPQGCARGCPGSLAGARVRPPSWNPSCAPCGSSTPRATPGWSSRPTSPPRSCTGSRSAAPGSRTSPTRWRWPRSLPTWA